MHQFIKYRVTMVAGALPALLRGPLLTVLIRARSVSARTAIRYNKGKGSV